MNSSRHNTSPLLSVVTVVFNRKHEIEATIQSVLNQQFPDLEFVVIDGGSNDGTTDIIRKYADKIDYWVSERDKGIYDAMNKGAQAAKGEWIIFMNAGDQFHDGDVLKSCAHVLRSASDKIFVYGDAEIVAGEKKHIQHQRDRHLDFTKSIIHQATFVKRTFLQQFPYNTFYRVMADYDSLLSVSIVTPEKCLFVDRIICRYDKTGISSRPLYSYFKEFYTVARRRMPFWSFVSFNFYILPRLVWSYRLALR